VNRLIDRDLMFGNLVEVSTPTLVASRDRARDGPDGGGEAAVSGGEGGVKMRHSGVEFRVVSP
jgi:hypothetical protein